MMDIYHILTKLPHRYPFLLVDRVVEFEKDKRVLAYKNVTCNEPFFTGHFPGHPVMPGVLQVEAMAQAIVNKLLHLPTARLKQAASDGDSALPGVVAELFGIQDEPQAQGDRSGTVAARGAASEN